MKREHLFGVITACFSLGFCVLGVESFVRLVIDDGMQYELEMWKYARDVKRLSANPSLGHEHAPNRRAVLMGVEVQTNSHGLRDREFPYDRAAGRQRILMLGDSVTFGWGVAMDDTFAKRVEKFYSDDGIPAEVINAGTGNYNTAQEVTFFFTEGFKYRPDVVVLNYFVNDAEIAVLPPFPSLLARNCASCNLLAGRVDAVLRRFSVRQNWIDYYLSLYGEGKARGWLEARDHIRRLAAYCKANHMRLLIVSVPELHDVRRYQFQRITDLVSQTAAEVGAAFVDVLPYLSVHESADLWVTPPDPHPNALAHEAIARGIFDSLLALAADARMNARGH